MTHKRTHSVATADGDYEYEDDAGDSDFALEDVKPSSRSNAPRRSRARGSADGKDAQKVDSFPSRTEKEIAQGMYEYMDDSQNDADERRRMGFCEKWMGLAYAWSPGRNSPRQALFNAYVHACKEFGAKPVNSACFGKVIRSHFPAVGSRRLGARRHSRYHYCDIWPTTLEGAAILQHYDQIELGIIDEDAPIAPYDPDIQAASAQVKHEPESEEEVLTALKRVPKAFAPVAKPTKKSPARKRKPRPQVKREPSSESELSSELSSVEPPTPPLPAVASPVMREREPSPEENAPSPPPQPRREPSPPFVRRSQRALLANNPQPSARSSPPSGEDSTLMQEAKIFDFAATAAQAGLPASSAQARVPAFPTLPPQIAGDELAASVWNAFEQHSIALLDVAQAFRFDLFRLFICQFYEHQAAEQLTRSMLEHQAFAERILRGTSLVYSAVLVWLGEQLHRAVSPHALAALDATAQSLSRFITKALEPFKPSFSSPLIALATQFSRLCSRQTALLQMAPSIRATVQDVSVSKDLYATWQQINFARIAELCATSSAIPLDQLDAIMTSLAQLLLQQSLGNSDFSVFLKWLDRVYAYVAEHQIEDVPAKAAYIVGLILRDLTLRAEQTLASFHLLALFAQEYIGLRLANSGLSPSPTTPARRPSPLSLQPPSSRVPSASGSPMLRSPMPRYVPTSVPSPTLSSHPPTMSPYISPHGQFGTAGPATSPLIQPSRSAPMLASSPYTTVSPTAASFGEALKSPVHLGFAEPSIYEGAGEYHEPAHAMSMGRPFSLV